MRVKQNIPSVLRIGSGNSWVSYVGQNRTCSQCEWVLLPFFDKQGDGNVYDTADDIIDLYTSFYFDLYCEDPVEQALQSYFLDNLNVSVTEDLCVGLKSSLELSEMDTAVRSMANGRTPDEDGIPKEFDICFLDLIGPDLLGVFHYAF